jgi:glycosyltransferase involved in cell wall biosynthesis
MKVIGQNMPTDERKRILILTDTFAAIGGSERNISQLLTGLEKDKFQLIVACFISGNLAQEMRNRGFSIFDLRRCGIYTVGGVENLAFLRKLIKEKKISLIVSYHEASDFYGLVLSRICNIPVVSSRRDMGFKTKLHHRMAYRLIGRYFDAVIAVSNAVKEEVIKRGWFPEKKIFTIYNAINVSEYGNTNDGTVLRRKIGIAPKRPVVGVVANMRKIKGQQYFIEAASIINRHNRDVEFLIIGDNTTKTRAEFNLLAKELNVSQNLHFLGKRSDIADLISIFDVAVVASLSEGFSNAILEYMASSRPIVATEVGGNPESVVHGETGLLVPPGDAHALAKAILSILEDREMALRFGMAGRKIVEERFSLEIMLRKYENLFEQVMISKKDTSPLGKILRLPRSIP